MELSIPRDVIRTKNFTFSWITGELRILKNESYPGEMEAEMLREVLYVYKMNRTLDFDHRNFINHITFSKNVTELPLGLFCDSKNLGKVVIPEHVKKGGAYNFMHTKFTSLTIENPDFEPGEMMFEDSTRKYPIIASKKVLDKVTKMQTPEKATAGEKNRGCKVIKTYYPDTIRPLSVFYTSPKRSILTIYPTREKQATGSEYTIRANEIIISDGVEHITETSFYGTSELKRVVIAPSVKKIDQFAFTGKQDMDGRFPSTLEEIIMLSDDVDLEGAFHVFKKHPKVKLKCSKLIVDEVKMLSSFLCIDAKNVDSLKEDEYKYWKRYIKGNDRKVLTKEEEKELDR